MSSSPEPTFLYSNLKLAPRAKCIRLRVARAKPWRGSGDREAPGWRVTFTDGCVQYQWLSRFPTKVEADDYASDFLVRLRGENTVTPVFFVFSGM
jgi:hypothetical protein